MIGPFPKGHWSSSCKSAHQFLVPERRYAVVQPFRDYDGNEHPAGESWVFLGSNFAPHDDGLSLFVSLDGEREWHLRMRWAPEDQGPILDNLAQYVAAYVQ
jgi:hypothetical protein